jgi:hypothetical protein
VKRIAGHQNCVVCHTDLEKRGRLKKRALAPRVRRALQSDATRGELRRMTLVDPG